MNSTTPASNNNTNNNRSPRNNRRSRPRKTKENNKDNNNSHTASPKIVKADADAEDDEEAEVCVICAEPVKFYSVSQCNHRVCHVCSLRLRALYKNLDCTLCKVSASFLLLAMNFF